MASKVIRIALFAVIFGFGIYQFVEANIGNGIGLILLSGLVLLTYFKNENILIAFFFLRKQNVGKAEKALSRIKNPEKSLIRSQQAYFFFLKGILSSQKNFNEAEKALNKALKIGLKAGHDKAMAKLSLAGIYLQKRQKRRALNLITEAKKLDKSKLLKEQIKMVETQAKRV